MAKLNGVKTLDMVGGEITKVAYDGAEYIKVANDFQDAQTGDLFLNTNNGGYYEITIRNSDFFGVNHPVRFTQDSGKETGYMRGCSIYPLFRKISVQTPSPTIEARVDKLEAEVSALKGEQSTEVIASDETLSFEGEQYRKVDRKAQAGDVFVINHNDGDLPTWFTVGKPYKATAPTDSTEEVSVIADDGDDLHVYNDGLGRTTETIDVYEKVEAKQSSYVPQEGDIVVITANTNSSRNAVGDIGKVIAICYEDGDARVEVIGKETPSNWTLFDEMCKATPVEVAAYEKAVADASKPKLKAGDFVKVTEGTRSIVGGKVYEVFERSYGLYIVDNDGDKRGFPLVGGAVKYEIIPADDAKWAKIGRKVGEFKKGDIVRVLAHESGRKVGEIGFIEDAGILRSGGIGIRFADDSFVAICYDNEDAELIVPVDARFDK